MDLSKYDTTEAANTGTFLHLESPDGTMLYSEDGHEPVGITLLGADSRKIRELSARQQNRYIKGMKIKRSRINTGMSAEQTEEDNLELLAAAVVSFHHVEFHGKACEPEDAYEVFKNLSWVREQAAAHINDTEAYLGEGARS